METETIPANPVQKILQKCSVATINLGGIATAIVKLPPGQLDRKLYQDVAKALELIGGKWKGGKTMGFVFKEDPTDLLEQIASGKKRNIKKEFQFFGTPDVLCDKAVALAEIKEGDCVLEPSAGQGAMIKAIYRAFPHVMQGPNDKPGVAIDYCELMELNRTVLSKVIDKSRTSCMGEDFMKADLGTYKRIIANPPFNKNQDIQHFRKMYGHLQPGGILVSFMSIGWMYGSVKAVKEFRAWLDDKDDLDHPVPATQDRKWHLFANIGKDCQFHRSNGDRVYIEMIEPGAFKESGTTVKTALVVIQKK